MIKKVLLLVLFVFASCNFKTPTEFSNKALNEDFIDFDGQKKTFKEIIDKHKGKKIFIDVWASWCADCIRGLPRVKELQKEYPDVVFLFLSVDKEKTSWKNGVRRFKIKGEHYNLPKGMNDGDFVDFIGLRWIPRYMILDESGKIKLFKATRASDSTIVKVLNKTF